MKKEGLERPVPGFPAYLSSPALSMALLGCAEVGCVTPLRTAGGPPPHVLTPWALPVVSERWSRL